jgi:hypothetical protein
MGLRSCRGAHVVGHCRSGLLGLEDYARGLGGRLSTHAQLLKGLSASTSTRTLHQVPDDVATRSAAAIWPRCWNMKGRIGRQPRKYVVWLIPVRAPETPRKWRPRDPPFRAQRQSPVASFSELCLASTSTAVFGHLGGPMTHRLRCAFLAGMMTITSSPSFAVEVTLCIGEYERACRSHQSYAYCGTDPKQWATNFCIRTIK